MEIENRRQINDLETLKVLSDPFRVQLLEAVRSMNLAGDLATVKLLAGRFERSPKKLYYHINLLEKHDLIRVAETRLVSGIVEKQYQVSALDFVVDENIFSQTQSREERESAIISVVSGFLDATKNEVTQLVRASADQSEGVQGQKAPNHVSKDYVHLTPEQVLYFQKRLQEIAHEFAALGSAPDTEETQYYSLTAVFFPVITK